MRSMRLLAGLAVGLLALAGGGTALADAPKGGKIRVVIIDGQNNHDWRSTTPVMKKELEESGRFTVDVAPSPQVPSLQKPNKPKDENDEKAVAKYKEALAKYEEALPKFQKDQKAAQE